MNKNNEVRKPLVLPREMHDDFLKVCHHNEHDFCKRVRLLIKNDIENFKQLLNEKQIAKNSNVTRL